MYYVVLVVVVVAVEGDSQVKVICVMYCTVLQCNVLPVAEEKFPWLHWAIWGELGFPYFPNPAHTYIPIRPVVRWWNHFREFSLDAGLFFLGVCGFPGNCGLPGHLCGVLRTCGFPGIIVGFKGAMGTRGLGYVMNLESHRVKGGHPPQYLCGHRGLVGIGRM